MPNFKGHLLGGAIAFSSLTYFSFTKGFFFHKHQLAFRLLEFVVCLMGSMFPDIDINSHGRKVFDFFIAIAMFVSAYCEDHVLVFIFFCMIVFTRLVGHRKILHNPLFIIVAPYLFVGILKRRVLFLNYLESNVYFYFVAGALSHILLDFWPKAFLPSIFYTIDSWTLPKWIRNLNPLRKFKNFKIR